MLFWDPLPLVSGRRRNVGGKERQNLEKVELLAVAISCSTKKSSSLSTATPRKATAQRHDHGCSKEDAQVRADEEGHRTEGCEIVRTATSALPAVLILINPQKEEPRLRRPRSQKETRRRTSQARSSPGLLRALLPSQHRPRPALQRPRRYQLPLAHRARKTGARQSTHGPPLR